ncbi:hypothetical protein THICB3560254 [Thiomonas sp. CB3]|nr:hypothetical protein THICB3560254 [Thiomonas sp. CB3]
MHSSHGTPFRALPTMPRAGVNDACASPDSLPSPTIEHFLSWWISLSPNLHAFSVGGDWIESMGRNYTPPRSS